MLETMWLCLILAISLLLSLISICGCEVMLLHKIKNGNYTNSLGWVADSIRGWFSNWYDSHGVKCILP